MASVDSAPTPLHGRPGRRTSLVGRETAIRSLTELLARSDVRLVTLTGPGGIGKTRLAEQVLDRLPNAFPGVAAFIDLSPVQSPDLVLAAIARSTGVPDDPGRPLLARTLDFLAGHRALLVIDNVEHVRAAMVPVAIDLLDGCPTLTILATSRIPLDISGERVVPVPPLDAASAREMFLDRATARSSGLDITTDQHTIDAICARLDGLPLAIELAAAHTPVLPPRALLARLERSLPLLANGPHDAPARQRSMRDTIAWSHDLLTERQRTVMRRLGVFVGGFTLDAATAVANDGEDCLPEISALVAASLVRPIPGVGDDPRFTMLETIREYALDLLAVSGEEEVVRARHAAWYQQLAEFALPRYSGPEMRLWNARVNRELDNCRAAMAWALDRDAGEIGARLAGALWRVWKYRQVSGARVSIERVQEGRGWCERVLARWPGLPLDSQVEALIGAGFLADILGETERALTAGESLLARSIVEDHPYGVYWAHHLLGVVAFERWQASCLPRPEGASDGASEAMRKHFEASLAVAPIIRDPEQYAALALRWLGTVARLAGNLDEAGTRLVEALALCRISGSLPLLAEVLGQLGDVTRDLGDIPTACGYMKEGYEAYVTQDDLANAHGCLVDIADMAMNVQMAATCARILAAADTLPAHLDGHQAFNDLVASARFALGGSRFDKAWDAGRKLSCKEVVAEIDALVANLIVAHIQPASHGLTRRELDVLVILTEGCSNRAIANRLSLSERTVENHVLHILTKLDLDSRTAAAAWAVRNGLA